jgi:hypothetical protein
MTRHKVSSGAVRISLGKVLTGFTRVIAILAHNERSALLVTRYDMQQSMFEDSSPRTLKISYLWVFIPTVSSM